jgi:hypothetical protein
MLTICERKVLLGLIMEQNPFPVMLEWEVRQMMLIEAEAKGRAEKGNHCSDRKTYFSGPAGH